MNGRSTVPLQACNTLGQSTSTLSRRPSNTFVDNHKFCSRANWYKLSPALQAYLWIRDYPKTHSPSEQGS